MAYTLLAYLILPALWTHYEHQKGLADLPMVTRTAQGIPGDPINVGLIGDTKDVLCAMHAAGWYPADPVTLRSSIEIAGSVLLDRPYRDAPVSPLFYLDRREDLAFEKPDGNSADHRHHVRFWKVLEQGHEKRPVWLGDATFDRSVGVSRYTGAITHHIDADIDAERKLLAADLEAAGMVEAKYQVTGMGPTFAGTQWRRRSLLHRRRGLDPAPGGGVREANRSRRRDCQPGSRPRSRIRSGRRWRVRSGNRGVSPSFRGDAQQRTRNPRFPRCAIAHLRFIAAHAPE